MAGVSSTGGTARACLVPGMVLDVILHPNRLHRWREEGQLLCFQACPVHGLPGGDQLGSGGSSHAARPARLRIKIRHLKRRQSQFRDGGRALRAIARAGHSHHALSAGRRRSATARLVASAGPVQPPANHYRRFHGRQPG